MSENTRGQRPTPGPSPHELAIMVWIAVLPTVTVLQFLLGGLLTAVPLYLRTPIMVTLAIPLVVYVLMPRLQRLHAQLARPGRLSSRSAHSPRPGARWRDHRP